MTVNMAMKRAAKANRRKAALAQRRREEVSDGTLAGQVGRAAGAPIQHCLVTGGLFDIGLGAVILARGPTRRQLALGTFLVDVHCLGIKDLLFRAIGGDDFAMYVDRMGAESPVVPVEPAYARKLLRDLAAWAGSIGFAPPADFVAVERLFGDVRTDDCDEVFQFGRNGKPLYVPGPSESTTQARRRQEHLRRQLGDEGYAIGDDETPS
jgi:hypothetical protein